MSKRILEAYKLYNEDNFYSFDEAIDILLKYKEVSSVKFDESVDVVVNLGVDTNKTDQNIKSFVELPHGTGKKVRIVVFANDDNIDKALAAGAVYAGGDELIAKIEKGELTFIHKNNFSQRKIEDKSQNNYKTNSNYLKIYRSKIHNIKLNKTKLGKLTENYILTKKKQKKFFNERIKLFSKNNHTNPNNQDINKCDIINSYDLSFPKSFQPQIKIMNIMR